ncbi:MAG: hypothetical protein ACP5JG_00310 [Anaerolineae bacterium]
MVRKGLALILALTLTLAISGTTLAAPGGMPAAHGASGAEWGEAVSAAAQMGGLGEHASGGNGGGNGGGMPAAHGLAGAAWGEAVSTAAQMGGLGGHAGGR